jgi:hypothetical protein
MKQCIMWTLLSICGRFKECRRNDEQITIGNRHKIVVTKLGDLKCEVTQVNGSNFEVILKEVKHVPDLWVNLFRINKALKNGFKLRHDRISIRLVKVLFHYVLIALYQLQTTLLLELK